METVMFWCLCFGLGVSLVGWTIALSDIHRLERRIAELEYEREKAGDA